MHNYCRLAISVWFIPTKYVDCKSERWKQKKYFKKIGAGLAGLLPQHPRTYMLAWRNRDYAEKLNVIKELEANEES
jgi:hypothetical protein